MVPMGSHIAIGVFFEGPRDILKVSSYDPGGILLGHPQILKVVSADPQSIPIRHPRILIGPSSDPHVVLKVVPSDPQSILRRSSQYPPTALMGSSRDHQSVPR